MRREAPWALRQVAPLLWEGSTDDTWLQGRGVYGGLQAALAAEAMIRACDDGRALRSLTLHCCSPVAPGPVSLRVEVLRAGARVTHATARLEQAGATVAFATGSLAHDRPDAVSYLRTEAPQRPEPEELRVLPEGMPVPAFFQHFEARFGVGALPFSGGDPHGGAWIRLREPRPLDAQLAVAMLDTLPPALYSTLTAPRPIATVDLSMSLFARLPLADHDPKEPLLIYIRSRWADHGYTEEQRELWTRRGQLVGFCRQLLAVMGLRGRAPGARAF